MPSKTRVEVSLHNQDCFEAFALMPNQSVDSVITDPPYFLDKLGDNWKVGEMKTSSKNAQVTSLPVGMKFDPSQGRTFQEFMNRVAIEAMRVLKPGGFFLSFSAPRLYHRLGVAVEDAGFEIRDMWAWIYTQNQMKAMSVARFLDSSGLSEEQIRKLQDELSVWKTPQVKSCIEPIVFAQKPKVDAEGNPQTFLQNWLEHHVGLVNTEAKMGENADMAVANLITTDPINAAMDKAFLVSKPGKGEKGATSHLSVKPLALMDQLIRATTPLGGLVVDPFSGSGSTGISAVRMGCNYRGFELSKDYFQQSQHRFEEAFPEASWKAEGNSIMTSVEVIPTVYADYLLASNNASSAQ